MLFSVDSLNTIMLCNEDGTIYHKNSKYRDIYVAQSVDSDQTALQEQFDQDLHCLPFCLHILEALLLVKLNFYIKDNYGS